MRYIYIYIYILSPFIHSMIDDDSIIDSVYSALIAFARTQPLKLRLSHIKKNLSSWHIQKRKAVKRK